MIVNDHDWQLLAACGTHPVLHPNEWTDPPGRRGANVNPQVIEVCNACPVYRQCDEVATMSEQWGVWAGRTHWERYGREPRYEASAVLAERRSRA